MVSATEENYLKALLQLQLKEQDKTAVGTNELANHLLVKPATANDMLKKLKDKQLVDYEKYGKITLTDIGRKLATEIVRKHRLWETFLYEKLDFSWDEVHEVAEQLEHIQSNKLIDKLAIFLGNPTHDPHGDIIPQANGNINIQYLITLAEIKEGETCKMMAVKDNSPNFLQYIGTLGLAIQDEIMVVSAENFDGIINIQLGEKVVSVSKRFAQNIYVICENCVIGNTCPTGKCQIITE